MTSNYNRVTSSRSRYTVTLDSNGGSSLPNIAAAKDEPLTALATPVKLGYKFAGWTLDGKAYDLTAPVTSDMTLAASWERITSDTEVFEGKQSILLIGQSNMVGVGNMLDVAPIVDARLTMLRGDRWWPLKEPLHTNTYLSGTCLAASFAKAFVDKFDCELGVIPAAKGSTTIDMWEVGGDLYNEAVRVAKIAKESSNICAILWHQGESSQSDLNYANKLKVILDSLIEEVGLDTNNLVIITGELSEAKSERVAFAERLARLGEEYERYGIASADGLTLKSDNLHFNAESQRLFGLRYFEQFYRIVTDKKFEYENHPDYYYSPQKAVDESYYSHFDDMSLGKFGHPFKVTISGSCRFGIISRGGDGSVAVYEKEKDGLDRYIVVTSDSDTSTYYAQSITAMVAGRAIVVEADYKLVDGASAGSANLLRIIGADIGFSPIQTAADGTVYVVNANGSVDTDSVVTKLNSNEWISIKIVFDFRSNTRSIYANEALVFEQLPISTSDVSDFAVTTTRTVDFTGTAAGSIAVDNFKCYYADAE